MTGSRKIFNMVIALLVSIAAWIFVVYNYDPMTPVKYTEVPVSFTGEDDLAERGLAVSEASTEAISVTLSQKRVDGSSISAEDIRVTADVSDCIAGDNNVALNVRGPDGTSVTTTNVSSIDVSVARTRTEVMNIEVVYGEGAEENEEPLAFDLSHDAAEVSCSADTMDDIAKIAAVLNYEDVTETVKSFTVDLEALDKDGNVIPHVVISPDEISLDASAAIVKTVPLNVPVTDDSDDDYERTYNAPSTVTIKGAEADIDKIGSVTANEIDISYIYSDTEIEIVLDLPEGVYLVGDPFEQKVTVRVTEKETDETEETEG